MRRAVVSGRPVALVTGSSSGIGAAIATALAAEGTLVVINSSSTPGAGQALAAEIGGRYRQADVSDRAAAADLVGGVVADFGRLDILVNSAGVTAMIPHEDLDAATPEIWQRVLGVNMLAPWWLSAAAVPHLRAAAKGQIINVSSTSANRVEGSSIPYAVSKAGLEHMTRLLAKALGPEVRVNAVAPGFTDTPWTDGWDQVRRTVEESVPMRRAGTPKDVADACIALYRANYLTGVILPVDGGLSLL